MNRIADIIAKGLSVLFYPLFIPTYGMVLFCPAYFRYMNALTASSVIWSAVAIIGTLLLTCVLPITAIFIMVKRGEVTDLQMDDPKERKMPYIYSLMGFAFWAYLLIGVLKMPLFISMVSIGGAVAIGLVAIINRWWKISAHLTGFGGLTGGVLSYCLGTGVLPGWGAISLLLGIALALMFARLYLKAHTPEQVAAGWLLGIACTTLPYFTYYYVA